MMGLMFGFGLGYSFHMVGHAVQDDLGFKVAGTTTTAEKKAHLIEKVGLPVYFFDRERPLEDPAAAFAGVTHILCSIPPDEDGDIAVGMHGKDIAAIDGLQWAGLLSTTGVYGDRGGEWVDEDSDLKPNNHRSELRVKAEEDWLALHRDYGVPAHVFRLAGIYGPGRGPLDQVRSGHARRLIKPDLVLGRIHLDDIVGAVMASIAKPNPGRVYNVTDDEPMPPQDIITYACELLRVEAPPEMPYADADVPPIVREFYDDCKRVSNKRLKEELGYTFKHPTYRDGLRALLAKEQAQAEQ
jgi:hypothetical protein